MYDVEVLGGGQIVRVTVDAADPIGVDAVAIVGNGDKFLFDVGTGSNERIAALQIPFNFLDKVFLSHLHTDHFGDQRGISIQPGRIFLFSRTDLLLGGLRVLVLRHPHRRVRHSSGPAFWPRDTARVIARATGLGSGPRPPRALLQKKPARPPLSSPCLSPSLLQIPAR